MRGFSVYGCGIMQLGLRRDDDGRLEMTRWVTLFYLPLLPLARWRVRYIMTPLLSYKEDETFNFAPLERLPLEAAGALWTAWCGWSLVALAIAPALLCVFGIQGAANTFEMVLVFASCGWPLVLLILVQRRWRALVNPPLDEEPLAMR